MRFGKLPKAYKKVKTNFFPHVVFAHATTN